MMNRRFFLRSLAGVGLLSLGAAGFSAPQDAAGVSPKQNAPDASASAQVRVIHASPDAPAVDVLLDGNKSLENAAFKKVSDYMAVPAGAHQVKVVATGTDNAVIDAPVTLKPGSRYTIVAVGKASDSSIKPLVLEDVTPKNFKTRGAVRVIYAIPDGPPVDIVIPQTKKGPPAYIAKNLTTGTATDYVSAPPGTYSVEVRPAGQSTAVKKINVTVTGATAYTVVAFGLVSDAANIDVQTLKDMPLSYKQTNKIGKKSGKAKATDGAGGTVNP